MILQVHRGEMLYFSIEVTVRMQESGVNFTMFAHNEHGRGMC